MSRNRWFVLLLTLLAVFALTGAALADGPVDGRAGRAEIRFLEGMIDHHQMALDMANHCLTRASSEEVLALCQAVIAAQTPEIEQMQAWLRDWYSIDYQPMAMVGATVDHSQHQQQGAAAGTDHSQHQQGASAGEAGGMCNMMGGEGCAMMGSGGMSGMMDGMQGMMGGMMGEGGMGMMGGDMMPMMQMQMMMMQMQMMQMMMSHMGMGGMQGMSGMGMGMMGEGGMSGMGMMGGSSDPAMQQSAAAALAQTAPDDHSAHHPAAEATAEATDHSQHQTAPAAEATPEAGAMPGMNMGGPALVSDPAMTMGMLAGLDRLTGADYDIAWLEAMVEHHDGALHMAGRVQMWAQHPELQALAEAIITAQTAEIEQMEALISELSA
jgi:uncharacterized protein (DUF305 family)